jgi:hypothetical protein
MVKPLSPSSEPCDKDKNKVARQVRVRAQDGPHRGSWFRFFVDDEATLLDLGKTMYLLERNDDPRRWGLREHLRISI